MYVQERSTDFKKLTCETSLAVLYITLHIRQEWTDEFTQGSSYLTHEHVPNFYFIFFQTWSNRHKQSQFTNLPFFFFLTPPI